MCKPRFDIIEYIKTFAGINKVELIKRHIEDNINSKTIKFEIDIKDWGI